MIKFLNKLTNVLIIIFIVNSVCAFSEDHSNGHQNNEKIVSELLEGNKRFLNGSTIHPHQDKNAIEVNSKGQHPSVAVVSCSDSRVPVEILFDQGIGDIFVIRTAGNIVGTHELGSIQYAVEHLGVRCVCVMGHTECGAVKAFASGHEGDGCIKDIVKFIANSEEIKKCSGHKDVDTYIHANIKQGVKNIENDPLIKKISSEHGEVKVIPMLYHIDSGLVEIDHSK